MLYKEPTFTEDEYLYSKAVFQVMQGNTVEVGTQLHNDLTWAAYIIKRYEEVNGLPSNQAT